MDILPIKHRALYDGGKNNLFAEISTHLHAIQKAFISVSFLFFYRTKYICIHYKHMIYTYLHGELIEYNKLLILLLPIFPG